MPPLKETSNGFIKQLRHDLYFHCGKMCQLEWGLSKYVNKMINLKKKDKI